MVMGIGPMVMITPRGKDDNPCQGKDEDHLFPGGVGMFLLNFR